MSKSREKLTLINATDEAMMRSGHLNACDIHRVKIDAIVDTDFVRSVISKRIADELGVVIRNGVATTPIVFEYLGGQTVDEAVIGDGTAIIGRSVADKLRNPGRIKPRFMETAERCQPRVL